MDDLERLKNQEKEAYEEAEALRKKFETLVIKEGAAKPSICACSSYRVSSFDWNPTQKVTMLGSKLDRKSLTEDVNVLAGDSFLAMQEATIDEGAASERPSEALPTPSPAPTSDVPNELQTDSSPAQTSEVPFEQQTDQSQNFHLLLLFLDSIPETLVRILEYRQEGVSTDKEIVSTDRPIVSIDGSKISTDEQVEGTEEHNEKKFKQLESDEELARKLQVEWEEERGKKQIA
ncbi:hypothetical protein Tco_0086197 [Tanacetum coccineum]